MKKTVLCLLVLALFCVLLTGCTGERMFLYLMAAPDDHKTSEWIDRPQNVFEEIWNLVLTEQHTDRDTVLTSTARSEVDYDLGVEFVGIHIPACNVTVGWYEAENGKQLSLLFPLGKGEYVRFCYDRETKTVYGNADISYLKKEFLSAYFSWCEWSYVYDSDFSIDTLGGFQFR